MLVETECTSRLLGIPLLRRRRRQPPGMAPAVLADLAQLRLFYGALGLGFPAGGNALFGVQEDAEWHVTWRGRIRRCLSAQELVAEDLFHLPWRWELMRVRLYEYYGRLTRHGEFVCVSGSVCSRPHGDWQHDQFPFVHQWTLKDGRALRLQSPLSESQLVRVSPLLSPAAG